jgi:hypothetical protein
MAKHARSKNKTDDIIQVVDLNSETASKKKSVPVYQKRSRKMRITLIVVIVLLLALIAALGYLTYQLVFVISQDGAVQQTRQDASQGIDQTDDGDVSDTTSATQKTEVPHLISFIGLGQAEAIEAIGHGATVVSTSAINEEGNLQKTRLKILLTDEPGDVRSGTPTVYLGLDEAGLVIMAGYSAPTSTLGYGSLSFSDALINEKIIERTFASAGITIAEDAIELPASKSEYSTYGTDGTTLVSESRSFEGSANVDGVEYFWSAILSYDYTAANASGILSDTIRQVYIYVSV